MVEGCLEMFRAYNTKHRRQNVALAIGGLSMVEFLTVLSACQLLTRLSLEQNKP